MTETELVIQQLSQNWVNLEEHLINIESGLQILLTLIVAFFVWQVIKVLYQLFGGIFFGGL